MRHVFKVIVLGLTFLLLPAIFPIQARAVEKISLYDVEIEIHDTGIVDIEETILYDFGYQERHGIFRNIPLIFEMETPDGKKEFELDMENLSVFDESGESYMFDKSTSNGEIQLKIGDPNVTISGENTYIISYQVSGAIRYFEDHDELFFDAIGPEWDVPIEKALVKVTYPFDESHSTSEKTLQYRTRCFVGAYSSTEEGCTINSEEMGIAEFSATDLRAYEGMTVVMGVPKGLIARLDPKVHMEFFDTLIGKIVLIGIVILGLVWYVVLPVWIVVRWYLYGRDPDVGAPPTAFFESPQTNKGRKITPAETGALYDEEVHRRDVLSTLVDLARRGHLKIIEKEKNDFYFEKNNQGAKTEKLSQMPNFEVKLLTELFEKKKSVRLKDANLVTTVEKVKDMLYKSMVTSGFFKENPQSTRTKYQILGIIAIFFMNVPLTLTALIFGRIMPRKTVFGAKEASKAKGLYSFLKSQERQINFEGADPQVIFEKLLPYAVAFGVEKQWMKKFEKIDLKQPDWYQSHGTFNQVNMLSGMQSSFKSFNSAATPTSSSSGFSSGGGFSGGGVGGGGGGSW